MPIVSELSACTYIGRVIVHFCRTRPHVDKLVAGARMPVSKSDECIAPPLHPDFDACCKPKLFENGMDGVSVWQRGQSFSGVPFAIFAPRERWCSRPVHAEMASKRKERTRIVNLSLASRKIHIYTNILFSFRLTALTEIRVSTYVDVRPHLNPLPTSLRSPDHNSPVPDAMATPLV